MLLLDLEQAEQSQPVASGLDLVAVANQHEAVMNVLAVRNADGAENIARLLRRATRLKACEAGKAKRSERSEVVAKLTAPVTVHDFEACVQQLPASGRLRQLPSSLGKLEWCDACIDVSAAVCSDLTAHRRQGLSSELLTAYEEMHVLIKE